MADVIVVGAGMGGLSAAISLAASGLHVHVLEAAAEAGGKVGRVVVDGVEVDTGPSVLTLPDALDATLRLAGTSLADELTLTSPEPSFRYLYPDGTALDVFPDLPRTLASVEGVLGPAAAGELAAYLRYARGIWDAAAPRFVRGPAPSVSTLLRGGPRALGEVARIDPLRTLGGAIGARVRSEPLRWLLMRYATYVGSDPRRAPATLGCIAHVELGLGGHGVRGGMYEVTRALVRAAERAGVRIHCGTRVERLRVTRGRVEGVETEGGGFAAARAVVANVEAAHLLRALLPDRRRPPSGEPSTSGWTAVARARRRTGDAARVAHAVLFPRDYEAEFADVFDRRTAPREPTVYLCAQEACHGRAGWAQEEPVFLMANAPAATDGAPSSDEGAALRERVLERTRAAGLLDAGDALVWERTPAELAARFPGSGGALYGLASNSRLAAFRRPPNRVPGVRGVYLASGSAHPGGGVPLCILSGRAAATALLADLGRPSPATRGA